MSFWSDLIKDPVPFLCDSLSYALLHVWVSFSHCLLSWKQMAVVVPGLISTYHSIRSSFLITEWSSVLFSFFFLFKQTKPFDFRKYQIHAVTINFHVLFTQPHDHQLIANLDLSVTLIFFFWPHWSYEANPRHCIISFINILVYISKSQEFSF